MDPKNQKKIKKKNKYSKFEEAQGSNVACCATHWWLGLALEFGMRMRMKNVLLWHPTLPAYARG